MQFHYMQYLSQTPIRGEDPVLEHVPIVVIGVVHLIPTLIDLMSNFFDNIVPILVTLKLLVQC